MSVSLAFLTGGAVGPGELILVFVVVLLLFGPRRLPEVAKTLGKIVSEMRRASRDFQDQVMKIEEEIPKQDISSVFEEPAYPAALPPPQVSETGEVSEPPAVDADGVPQSAAEPAAPAADPGVTPAADEPTERSQQE
jgi:TatA/E family protein of Tat protein translocase